MGCGFLYLFLAKFDFNRSPSSVSQSYYHVGFKFVFIPVVVYVSVVGLRIDAHVSVA